MKVVPNGNCLSASKEAFWNVNGKTIRAIMREHAEAYRFVVSICTCKKSVRVICHIQGPMLSTKDRAQRPQQAGEHRLWFSR